MCCALRANEPVSPQRKFPDRSDSAAADGQAPDAYDRMLPGQQHVDAEPIVGKDHSLPPPPQTHANPRPLRAPKQPTAAERARHRITHLPYADWCPYCIAGKRPNSPHRRLKTSDEMPLLSGDYGFFGDGSNVQCTFLAIVVRPFGAYWACVVDAKGPTHQMVKSLSQFIIGCGLVRFRYRSDKEASLKALIEDAVRESGRHGEPVRGPDVHERHRRRR